MRGTTDFSKEYDRLVTEFHGFNLISSSLGSYYSEVEWVGWATSVANIISITFGISSPHYQRVNVSINSCRGRSGEVAAIYSILRSARDHYLSGYNMNILNVVTAEVLGDFIGMAKVNLSEGHKEVAAVLASAALEDTIKRYCIRNEIDTQSKSLQDLVNAMKAKGLVSGANKSILDTLPKIRDQAMHANWTKIDDPSIASMIGFVENFLMSEF